MKEKKVQAEPSKTMFSAIFSEEDVKWRSIIYELIRSGKIDPWDVDITKFTNEYMTMLEKLKEMNFRVSGKVVLAAAILLKIKTQRLGLDDFIVLTEEPEEDIGMGFEDDEFIDPDEEKLVKLAQHIKHTKKKKYTVEPKLVGPRKRKVTVFELVGALKKALEVDERRSTRRVKLEEAKRPQKKYEVKKVDILGKIKDVHLRLVSKVKGKKRVVPFNELVQKPGEKKDTIWTFIPLLHLANEEKVWLHQEESFSDIHVELLKEKKK